MKRSNSKYMRALIAAKLMALPEENQLVFRRMYCPLGANPLRISNIECIANIRPRRLAWALAQIDNTFKLIAEKRGRDKP